MKIPEGMRAPAIDWFGNQWRCSWGVLGKWGIGDTPNEAYESWFRANTPVWGQTPWSMPTAEQMREVPA